MSAPILKLHIDERDNISVRVSQDMTVLTQEEAERIEAEYKRMQAENAKLRELCEWLLNPYRLGAVTGEGVDRQWCRETYDGGTFRLRELGVEVDA